MPKLKSNVLSSKSPLVENEIKTQKEDKSDWPEAPPKTGTAGWNLVPTALKVSASVNFTDPLRDKLRG